MTESVKKAPVPRKQSDTQNTEAAAQHPVEARPEPVKKSCSAGLAQWMRRQQLAIAFTSYRPGRVYTVGAEPGGRLSFRERIFQRATGIVGNRKRIYLGGLYQVWRFENLLQPGQVANGIFDACYVPRNAQFTGDVDIRELGIQKDGKIAFVNTRYNCLAEPSLTHSFRAIWKPEFISEIAPQDRCHLNGMAMVDGKPKYVTALCKSDTPDGWREHRGNGGIIIDIETNEIVCKGLSMPHSPRWAHGRLWVLNSGTGYLGTVNFDTGSFVAHTFCPGFMRGLQICGDYAIVGLSKPRHGRFNGLELDQNLADKESEAWCGVQFINLKNGNVEHWIRLDGPVTELFDIAVLPGVRCPMGIGQQSRENLAMVTYEDVTGTKAAQAG
ncbi:TIGR03032 family protein [uncultured Microbulbifer sp.]|uniref:TIGR03032 family protein n=1 Tax=uncultured Microbulbifer sp. TaxID=348147 RepID=UPI0025CD40A7|nr:TIGR03032 family protein [uncultured Microbulbifer sp.]